MQRAKKLDLKSTKICYLFNINCIHFKMIVVCAVHGRLLHAHNSFRSPVFVDVWKQAVKLFAHQIFCGHSL